LTEPGSDAELYRLALWELGITAESALAVVSSGHSCRAAADAGLPIVVSSDGVRYDGLLVEGCRKLQRRSLIGRLNRRAASR
ncbi:MAG TPA: haloacid dehalogenase, partial [Mycobacterium sp.]|nr:haloacid dehalogenase [Mycobacterium sp.]